MSETQDARASLDDSQVSTRAAAAREVARSGDFTDVERLVGMATSDKSPSVRLYAAAAATAILMRGRGVYGHSIWGEAERTAVLDWVGKSDPARTPSLLLCYAAFPDTGVIKRLTRMLRDPRYGVRAGAVAALRRMALSGAGTQEPTALREYVGEALSNRKLPTDAAVELVRLVGEVGWSPLLPRARSVGAAVEDALGVAEQRLALRREPATWSGVWVDEGRDVMDEAPPHRARWMVLDSAVEPVDGELDRNGEHFRMIWAPRPASEGSFVAIQSGGRTWWRQEGKLLVQFVLDTDRALAECSDQVDHLIGFLDSADGAAAARARALLWARCGRPVEALSVLEGPLSGKKPRNDLRFIAGLAHHDAGDSDAARVMLATYLEKAKKNDPWRPEAEALLASIG